MLVVPGVAEETITVHWPAAFVGPVAGAPHEPPVIEPTPLLLEAIDTPAAGLQPEPSFFSTVTVKL